MTKSINPRLSSLPALRPTARKGVGHIAMARPMGRKDRRVKRGLKIFLEEIAKAKTFTEACQIAKVPDRTMRRWVTEDPRRNEAFEVALERANDVIRGEIHRRGVEGWDEPVFYKGEVCGHVRKFSDRMLELRAMARMQEFRSNPKVIIQGDPANPVKHEHSHTHVIRRQLDDIYAQCAGVAAGTDGPDAAADAPAVH